MRRSGKSSYALWGAVLVAAVSAGCQLPWGPSMMAAEKAAFKFLKAYVVLDEDAIRSMMTESGWNSLRERNVRPFGIADIEKVKEAVAKNFEGLAVEFREKDRGFLYRGRGSYRPYVRYVISIHATDEAMTSHPLVGKSWNIAVLRFQGKWMVYEVW